MADQAENRPEGARPQVPAGAVPQVLNFFWI
jgi:hypothetical protein